MLYNLSSFQIIYYFNNNYKYNLKLKAINNIMITKNKKYIPWVEKYRPNIAFY